MTFLRAVSKCFLNYYDFEGRASRAEYWWFFLFYFCALLAMGIAEVLLDPHYFRSHDPVNPATLSFISFFIGLILGLPNLAVTVRRLHDTIRSGWWFLLNYTIIGIMPLTIWLASKGDIQPNRFGHPS